HRQRRRCPPEGNLTSGIQEVHFPVLRAFQWRLAYAVLVGRCRACSFYFYLCTPGEKFCSAMTKHFCPLNRGFREGTVHYTLHSAISGFYFCTVRSEN